MKKSLLIALSVLILIALLVLAWFFVRSAEPSAALNDENAQTETDTTNSPAGAVEEGTEAASEPEIAFFYQIVGAFQNGIGTNATLIGHTADGKKVESYDATALEWDQGPDIVDSYGDPTFSRLPDGTWTLTSWTTNDDPRGSGAMMYWEGECPLVDDSEVIAINPSSAAGCEKSNKLQLGKTSQVFAAYGGTFVFHSTLTGLHLAHLSDATHDVTDLDTMCVLPEAVDTIRDLDWGESTPVPAPDDLLMSDSAIAQRADGTWVLFIKGIEKDSGCTERGGLCELCARGIYRTTSDDLVNWSEWERVVSQASVPEATQTTDGTVWLYYQDFSDTCDADNLQLANISPISGVHETGATYKMSTPVRVNFVDEAFQTNKQMHYATNGNPIFLPDLDAQEALEACVAQ